MIFNFAHRSRRWSPAFLFLGVALVLLASCAEPPPETLRLTGATMGTRYNITWLSGAGQPAPEAVHAGVEAVLEAVNASMSTWRDDSEITAFNAAPAGEWFALSRDFTEVFEMARAVSEASYGAYDVTVSPLVNLWGFGAASKGHAISDEVPPEDAIAEALTKVGQHRLDFDRERPALRKPDNMSVDFSSIAKGYGVDRVTRWLEEQGIGRYLVEIGGEIRVSGLNPRNEPWRIAVERPQPGERAAQVAVTLHNAAVATSGDYRNFFEVDGVRYSHTIDPRTGAPVRHDLVSVTVIHESATMADAWATALTVLGSERGMETALKEELAVYFISRVGDEFRASSTPAMAPLLRNIE